MIWEKNYHNLGEIKVGVKKEIVFIPQGELNNIDNMTSSCGCSIPVLVDNKIVVSYTPGSVPYHLSSVGKYNTSKTITITYKDGTQDKLSFSALVKK